jgi:sugar transferase (PEP-CTERM/EpsH1 system associated)
VKILWVKAGGLFPPDTGGKIRSYHILKALARRHSVTVFTFYAVIPGDLHAQLESQFARVVCLPLRIRSGRTFRDGLEYLRNFLSGLPYTVSKFCRPEVVAALRKLMTEQKPDVIVCDFVVAANVIPWEAPTPKILFTHNVEALIWKRHFQLAHNPLWKAVCWWEYQVMERFERSCVNRSDHLLTVSEHDRRIFSELKDPSRITVIPTGVDVDYFRPLPDREEANTLVFTGSMDWMPNEDGITFFIKEIWPRIRELIPDVSFAIVGRCPSSRLLELAATQQGIHITGRVDDIRPHTHRSSVYIVPLRIGSGTRLKIFEAMAMGKAVVSTTIGAEGLPVRSGREIVVADRADEFADAVVTLLRDSARRRELGRAARELVEQKYSWDCVVQPFEEVLEKLAGSLRPSGHRAAE